MVSAKKLNAWRCPDCELLHEHEDDAIDCCPKDMEQVEAFKCQECGEIYEDKEEAKECCK